MLFILLSIAGIMLIGYFIYWYISPIQRWKRRLDLKQHEIHFYALYAKVDGFSLSQEARQKSDAFEYTYGEIYFMSFIALLSLVKPGPCTRFYDLGSGTGKAVLSAAMVFKLEHCCGIERFFTLHEAAVQQKRLFEKHPNYINKIDIIQFIHDDFLKIDFSDATLVFINATAFMGSLWDNLSQKTASLAPGAIVITTSKPLISPCFAVQKTTYVEMSWGVVIAYIQQRLPVAKIKNTDMFSV